MLSVALVAGTVPPAGRYSVFKLASAAHFLMFGCLFSLRVALLLPRARFERSFYACVELGTALAFAATAPHDSLCRPWLWAALLLDLLHVT